MGRHRYSRSIATVASFFLIALAFLGSSRSASAQTRDCFRWIDAKTGERIVNLIPGDVPKFALGGPKETHYPLSNGHTAVQLPDGSWIDAGTGELINNLIPGDVPKFALGGPKETHYPLTNGHTAVLVPCPPPQTAASSGLYIGGELVKNWGGVRSTERLAATDVVTNQFSDHADPFGGGAIVGYKFAPWANNIIVSPFASFDFIRAPVNHTFPGGSYLGTTDNFIGTGGVKIGPQLDMGMWLYGIAGVSVLNETLKINFIPVLSTQSATVAGATVGVGGAMQPAFLQGFGHPVSLFLEYQHTWWQDANFNTPAASPLFNYTFRRDDDVVKLGFTVSLDSLPPAPTHSSMVYKAPPK